MANTQQAETTFVTFNIKEHAAKATVGGVQFEIAAGSGNVTVYAQSFKAIAPDNHLPAGEVIVGTENGTPVVTTTGVIFTKRPAAAPIAPAPTAKKESRSPKRTGKHRAAKKEKVKKEKGPSVLAEYFPKIGPRVGEDAGNGWICVSKPSVFSRLMHGATAPATVAKFVGEADFAALEKAARTAQTGSKIQDVHIPQEKELNVNFNAVAELVITASSTQKAVWMNNHTAFGLEAQGKKNPQYYRKYTSKSNNKFAGVLFATLKV